MWTLFKKFVSRGRRRKAPRIGLALGGGGVRGLAHVGVLAVLERENIPLHAIAGSSMGAIVGAAYTLNPHFSKEALTRVVVELGASIPDHLKTTQPDKALRDSLRERLRQFLYVERFILNTVSGWGMLPASLAEETLKRITPAKNLEDSPIPLAVVAVDLVTGNKMVFTSGPASLALKASSAIPGFLPPVPHGEQLLVDGAIVDSVPTDVVRDMNVDVIIAVDVDQEDVRAEINNGLEGFLRAVELSAYHHKSHHLALADVVINPQFDGRVQTFDVSKAAHCIERGAAAAEAALPEIRRVCKLFR